MESNGTLGGKKELPEISLEWADIKVSFRIVPEFELENDLHKQHYELFPKIGHLCSLCKKSSLSQEKSLQREKQWINSFSPTWNTTASDNANIGKGKDICSWNNGIKQY